jgi:hypothetical protein
MTEVIDVNEKSRARVVNVLEETAEWILGAPYRTEEGDVISLMSARSMATYAKCRLERENRLINDSIWRFQQIVNENNRELNELDVTIASELDKRDFVEQLENQMMTGYTSIDDKKETLAPLTGVKDYTPDEAKDWRDRMRTAKQGNTGLWKYVPKNPAQIKPEVASLSFSTAFSLTADCSQAVNEEGA